VIFFFFAKSNMIAILMEWRVVFVGTGLNILLQEYVLDGSYIRFTLLCAAPLLLCVSLASPFSVSL